MVSNIKTKVGTEYDLYTMKVEEGKIREFAEAIGDDNPIYYDLKSAKNEGFEGIPIPLTFLTVIDFWRGPSLEEKAKILQLDPTKVLHGEQEYEHIKSIYAGDILNVQSRVTNVDVKKGSSGEMDLITTENSYLNQKNELVARSKGVMIQRHSPKL